MDLLKAGHMPAVKAVMTPFPYSVDLGDPVTRAEEIMREHGVRHVPVQDDGELVGVISHRDIALHVNQALDSTQRQHIRVRQVCVRDHLFVVELSRPLDQVLDEMAERHIGSALVVRRGRLAGIFTMTDACRVLSAVLQRRYESGPDEAA